MLQSSTHLWVCNNNKVDFYQRAKHGKFYMLNMLNMKKKKERGGVFLAFHTENKILYLKQKVTKYLYT